MGLYDQFPYRNFHELNLEWLLKKVKQLETEITVKGNKTVPIKNHFRYHINGLTGDDNNDGLTSDTAFKTLEKFFSMSSIYPELRGYIEAPGNYYVQGDQMTGVSVHLTATVSNVKIFFEGDGNGDFSVYSAHWNLAGGSGTELTVGGAARMYFDNSSLSASYCIFNAKLRTYGSSAVIEHCSLPSFVGHCSNIRSNANNITNTDPSVDAWYLNNCVSLFYGSHTTAELTAAGTDNKVLSLRAGLCNLSAVIASANTNLYGYGVQNDGAHLFCTDARYTAMGTRSVNDNKQIDALRTAGTTEP